MTDSRLQVGGTSEYLHTKEITTDAGERAHDEVEILTDYYEVIMSSHYRHEIDLTDPVITALITAADA